LHVSRDDQTMRTTRQAHIQTTTICEVADFGADGETQNANLSLFALTRINCVVEKIREGISLL